MRNEAEGVVAEFDNVAVQYGRTGVLDAVTFTVPRGSVFAILGRNGAGKSSLLRCLVGLQEPFRGRVRLLDRDPWKAQRALMRRTGVVPEEPDAPAHLTVPELVELCGSFHEAWNGTAVTAQLKRMKIPFSVAFGSLSRGQKTATMMALALGHQPELLILDDPTLGLDAVAKRTIVDELIGTLAAGGVSVIVATHDLAMIERFAEQVVILGHHRLMISEGLESLKNRFRRIRGPNGADFSAFQVARTIDHPWGREAIVTDFSDERFESWRAEQEGAEALSLSLEEIFLATAGEEAES